MSSAGCSMKNANDGTINSQMGYRSRILRRAAEKVAPGTLYP
jgi:hypothetical protein